MEHEEIKNCDMPSRPVPAAPDGGMWTAHDLSEGGFSENYRPAFGMTKREEMVMHIMSNMMGKDRGYSNWHCMASDAVDAADALLEVLEGKK